MGSAFQLSKYTTLSRRTSSKKKPQDGDCAADGGIYSESYAVGGGVSAVVPVDLHIRGYPATPTQLLRGLLALLE